MVGFSVRSLLFLSIVALYAFADEADEEGNKRLDQEIDTLTKLECGKPNCKGLECDLLPADAQGCKICACPIGSKARGCDKMPKKMLDRLFKKGCPYLKDDEIAYKPAKKVKRYYRAIDAKAGTDECKAYDFPYCGEKLDHNLWRSPTNAAECETFCFPKPGQTTPPEATTAASPATQAAAKAHRKKGKGRN